MSQPVCPICQQCYSCERIPYILQPCSHGMCKRCIDEYITERENSSCPVCRSTILRHTVNYDMKELCSQELHGWKEVLMRCLQTKPNVQVQIQDSILPIASLLVKRISGNRDVHDSIVTMVRNMEAEDVYGWIDALQFPQDWAVERQATKLIRHKDFLDKYNASWVLEYV